VRGGHRQAKRRPAVPLPWKSSQISSPNSLISASDGHKALRNQDLLQGVMTGGLSRPGVRVPLDLARHGRATRLVAGGWTGGGRGGPARREREQRTGAEQLGHRLSFQWGWRGEAACSGAF